MIIISGTARVKPEVRDEAVAAAVAMMRDSAAESGCNAYRFMSDLEDPDVIHVYEEWENAEALAEHFEQPHFAEFGARLGGWLDGESSFMRHEVSSSAASSEIRTRRRRDTPSRRGVAATSRRRSL